MFSHSEENEEERNSAANEGDEEEDLQTALQRSIEHQPLADDDPLLQVFMTYHDLLRKIFKLHLMFLAPYQYVVAKSRSDFYLVLFSGDPNALC